MGKITTNSFVNKCAEFIRQTFYGNQQSDEDAARVCKKYNLSSKSEAIRFSLNLVAESDTAKLSAMPARRGRPPTKAPG